MSLSLQTATKLARTTKPKGALRARAIHQTASSSSADVTFREGTNAEDLGNMRIYLRGIPRSATPSDVLRFARQAVKDERGLAQNIAYAQLEYYRFLPTDRACVTLTAPHFVQSALARLRNTQMTSLPVRAFKAPRTPVGSPTLRKRGARGREDGVERAVLDGCGIGGGLKERPTGADVVMYGLPGVIASPAVRYYLWRQGLVGTAVDGEPDCEVLKVELPRRAFSMTSKHLIRLKLPAEAQALVRRMHMTFFLPEVYSQKHLIRAKVVY